MNKLIAAFFFIFLIASCSQKNTEPEYPVTDEKFDSVPKDSFSKGAISADVARKIRMSSAAYQDSLHKAVEEKAKQDAEQKQKDELMKKAEKSLENQKGLTKEKVISHSTKNAQ